MNKQDFLIISKPVGLFRGQNKRYLETPGIFEEYNYVFKKYFLNRRVLDVGCGNGFYGTQIADYADFVLGIDIQEILILQAQELSGSFKQSNTKFELRSAFTINKVYLRLYKIDSIFLHKAGGNWPKEKAHEFLNVLINFTDLKFLILNKKSGDSVIDTLSVYNTYLKYWVLIEFSEHLSIRKLKGS